MHDTHKNVPDTLSFQLDTLAFSTPRRELDHAGTIDEGCSAKRLGTYLVDQLHDRLEELSD